MRKIVLFALAISIAASASISSAEVKIGLLAKRGPEVAKARWTALGDYLSNKMGEKVTFVPLKFTEIMPFCRDNKDSFLFANSWFYVRAHVLYKAVALVTVQNQGSGVTFGGVIFAKKGSGVKTVRDLRGKRLMCPKFSSAGGWIFQKGVIVKEGIIPEKDCSSLLEGLTHDAVVLAVRDGKTDGGTVRTNILERMNREDKINKDDYVIIHEMKHENFPELVSTPLYPTWPIAALSKAPPAVAAKLKQALLDVPSDHPCLKSCKVSKFVEPLDYKPLEDLLRFLKAEPFRK